MASSTQTPRRRDDIRRRSVLQAFVLFFALLFVRAPAWAQGSPDHGQTLAIVGEGPVGLLAAIQAKRQGVADVTIYEARSEGRPGRQQTPMLNKETVAILREAGVDLSALTPIHTKTITTVPADGSPATTSVKTAKNGDWGDERFESVGLITTGDLENALRKVAKERGVKIVYDTEVRDAKDVDGHVDIQVGARTKVGGTQTPGESRRHDFVIFADGTSGLGSRFAERETVATMPMVGALTTKKTGENRIVRFTDPSSGETVSVSLLGTGQVLAQLPKRLAGSSPEAKQSYLEQQVARLGLTKSDLGARLTFNGELAHGTTGKGRIFVVGDASGAVPVVTSANLAIHMPLAAKIASTIAASTQLPKELRLHALDEKHQVLTAALKKDRMEVTTPVLHRMTSSGDPVPTSGHTAEHAEHASSSLTMRPKPGPMPPPPMRQLPAPSMALSHH